MTANFSLNLTAAIVLVENETPKTLAVHGEKRHLPSLPSGPFQPESHRTLGSSLRRWVATQTGLPLGYVEQLYTFADRARTSDNHDISIGYLALTRSSAEQPTQISADAAFKDWYVFFPWEDWRDGTPPLLNAIIPALRCWAAQHPARLARVRQCFGLDGVEWDEEKVLERYELLYEARLVHEAAYDGAVSALKDTPFFGSAMQLDHRRILATAISRLRGKLKYRPVVFELMPAAFTLTALQNTVEAISGKTLHKQNFRRLVEQNALVEPTGETIHSRGRPAKLFTFRHDVMAERAVAGLRV